jgi:hypothetical protein
MSSQVSGAVKGDVFSGNVGRDVPIVSGFSETSYLGFVQLGFAAGAWGSLLLKSGAASSGRSGSVLISTGSGGVELVFIFIDRQLK